MYRIGTTSSGAAVSLADEERRQHFYLIGGTGVGKSVLIENCIRQDISNGRGLCLIDPHSQLSEKIADSIPAERRRDTIYMNPMDTHVVGFNPLSFTGTPLQRATVASHIFAAFKHVHSKFFSLPYWGPQSEYVLTNALRLLLDTPGTTLCDLSRLFNDEDYRERVIENCKDHAVRDVWLLQLADPKTLKHATDPLHNIVSEFNTNAILRSLFGQKATINIRHIINNRKILICNLPPTMGEAPAHVLGALLVTSLYQAAQTRADMPEDDRQDFALYADEFQNFATHSFATILSEARKYRLNLVIAHQYLSQLPDELQKAVLGNVRTFCVFRIGPDDEPILRRHLGVQSLHETPDYDAWLRRSDAIKITTDPPEPPLGSLPAVLRRTRSTYARPRG